VNRGFREDENELPYLLWQKRDKIKAGNPKPFNINIQNRPFRDFESTVRGLIIPDDDRANIIRSVDVRPKNCRFSVSTNSEDNLVFTFDVENRYVRTSIRSVYEDHELYVSSYYNNHDRLESADWFKREVSRISRQIGQDYYSCASGYGYKCSDGSLTINDDCCILVYFGDDSCDILGEYPGYKIDFKKRKLVKYHVFQGHELFGSYYV